VQPDLSFLLQLLLVTFFLSLALTGLATWFARRQGMLDVPGDRHSHDQATPRGGGAGLVLTVLLMSVALTRVYPSAAWMAGILPGFLLVALVGWWDDRVSLSARLRFAVQLAVSLYLLWFLNTGLWEGPAWAVSLVLWLLAAVYLVWMTNLYNFMDGSNGMAGLQGVFAASVLAWLFYRFDDASVSMTSLVIAAACAGFLPWNLGNARVFMGDVASGALGFALGGLLVYGMASGAVSAPVAWLVMLVFVTDATLTLIRRVLKGERWYNPHKQHLYQRLIARGWSHGRVVLLYQAINLSILMPAIAVAVNFPALAMTLSVVATLVFTLGWALVMKKLGVLA